MQKLLLICLFIIASCKNKAHEALKNSSSESPKIDSLKVDLKILLNEKKDYIFRVDSIAALIDLRDKFKRSKTFKITQNDLETEIVDDGFSEHDGGAINKVITYGTNSKQKLIFEYYYLKGSIIKIVSKTIGVNSAYSVIYFDGNKIYKPSELSLNTAEGLKVQSVLLLHIFQ